MATNADFFKAHADRMGMPLRTLEQVRTGIERAKRTKADVSMARLMLRHGRLSAEARAWLVKEYPQ